MAYNGSGVFSPLYLFVNDAANGIKILASRQDAQWGDVCTNGLSNAITRDGQSPPTANLPMGTFVHTGAGNGQAIGQYLVYGQPQVNICAAVTAPFATTGTGLIANAFTQTDSTTAAGPVATAYGSVFGAVTLATAVNAVTVTNAYGLYAKTPVAGSHTTLTSSWAFGADNAKVSGTLNYGGAITAAFGTTGVSLIGSAFTQTDGTTAVGTVATAYGASVGAWTLATASNAITVTNGYGMYFAAPVAGSHVTLTNGWALGADNAKVNGLIDISGASAGQIKFPATQNASANANTLDDYQEFTWTPIDSSGAGLTFSAATGTGEKIGRTVIMRGAVTYPSTGSGADAVIGGAPYTTISASEANQGFISSSNVATANLLYLPPSTTTFKFTSSAGSFVANSTCSLGVLRFTALTHQ